MKEEKIKISVNQEDVQNIINCYEKDIEYIKQLEEENKSLQSQLKEKEEAIKEAREYNQKIVDDYLKEDDCEYCDGRYATATHNLEILSKGENK